MKNNAPLTAALLMAGIMKKRRKGEGYVNAKPNYIQKMISGPDVTIRKGIVRAEILGRSFSEHVMRLIEQDYARDERVVMTMTVAEETDEYLKFREENPPLPLPPTPPGQLPRNESRRAGGG